MKENSHQDIIDKMTVEECIQGIERLDICCNRAEIVREKAIQTLKQFGEYEKTGLTPEEIKYLQIKVVELELKLQGHDRELFYQRESVIDEISNFLRECGFTEASMAVDEYCEL